MPKIVCLGGGTGQSKLLEGLRGNDIDLTAIVAVTDSGRSTGVLRQEFDMLAPGDIRNCLVALSNSPKLMKDLFQFRFQSSMNDSKIHGMNFGNLFIAALTKLKGDNFAEAIKEVSSILNIEGKVLPSTLSNTQIRAKLSDGSVIEGDANISRTYEVKKRILKVFLKNKNSRVNPDCVEEIKKADVIVIGPGGLYTSVIVNLLPKGMIEAIKASKAKKVYVANVATQQGVTDDFDVYMHAKEVERYLGKGVLDYIIVNSKAPSKALIEKYRKAGANYLKIDQEQVQKLKKISKEVIVADVIQDSYVKEFGKADYIRHDPKKLANVVMRLVRKKVKGVILVAGKGERMKPFSIHQSKEMLEFLGRPLIAHHADEMIRNGIDEIVFICNEDNINRIREYFNNYYLKSIDSENILNVMGREIKFKFVLQTEQKGPVNAILYAREHLEDDYFIVKYGDSLAKVDQIRMILDKFGEDQSVDCVVTLRKVRKPQEYGIARFDDGKLVEIVEKPKSDFPSDLANVGLVLLNGRRFFTAADEIGVETVLPPAEYILRKKGNASYWLFEGERVDVGRVWNIFDAHKLMIEKYFETDCVNHVSCDPGCLFDGNPDTGSTSTVKSGKKERRHVLVKRYLRDKSIVLSGKIHKTAKIGRYVYIGPDAVIGKNVIIGDYSSVEGYIGDDSRIDDSIVMKGTRIGKSCRIRSSVFGEDSKIGSGFVTEVSKQKRSSILVYSKDKYVPSGKDSLGLFCASNVTIKDNLRSEPGKMVFPNKIVTKDISKDLLLRAIVFDADNTVYQTARVAKIADMAAMEFFSGQTTKSPEYLYDYWKKKIVPKVSKEKDPEKRHRTFSYAILAKKFRIRNLAPVFDLFEKTLLENLKLSKGFKEMLPELSDYKLVILTEDLDYRVKMKLDSLRISGVFDLIISSSDLGVMKPSEDYFRTVMSRLDVSPNECLFIGDSFEKDLEIPKRHGSSVILFGEDEKKRFDRTRKINVINDFSDLPDIIEGL